jgi:hypothetical protein
MLAPLTGSLPHSRWAWGPLSVPCRPGTPAYMLQAKTKVKACAHGLPRATAAPEPASLLREGSDAATCPGLRTPPLRLGGFRRCHVPRCFGPHLTIQEGSDAASRPSTPDPASPLRRAPALTRVLRLRTAPATEVGSGADTCPMALWAVGCKDKGRHSCNRHATRLACFQDMPARYRDACKTCGQTTLSRPTNHADKHYNTTLQCSTALLTTRRRGATVPHHAADRLRARWAVAMTR